MNDQVHNRIGAAIDMLFRNLNGGKEHGEYYVVSMPGTRYAFGIMRKFAAGAPIPAGMSRYHNYGGITRKQCQIIEATSHDVPEIAERIRQLIIDGRDTTVQQSAPVRGIDGAELDRLVTERVNAILAARTPPPAKTGLVDRTPSPPGKKQRDADKQVVLWTTRCEQMGIEAPLLAPSGKVHGNWLRKAEKLWAEFLKATAVPETQTA